MNRYLKNLQRIEFPITYSCNGRCKHCSEAGKNRAPHINGDFAGAAVKAISHEYNITSVMTFGGEPLLFPEDVYKIHKAAKEAGIPSRQLITNGCFPGNINETAYKLAESGCNAVLVSADAFHQETLPLERALSFALAFNSALPGSVKVQPAWIEGCGADNPYDKKTEEILKVFESSGVMRNEGNIIFPEGNAKLYLSKYFDPEKEYINPYRDDPKDLRAVSIEPDGRLLGGSIYEKSALEILEGYGGNYSGY